MTAKDTIPHHIHLVWVGKNLPNISLHIKTWRDHHPAWNITLWDNTAYEYNKWQSRQQMRIFETCNAWENIADIMRYEILHRHGGFCTDGDTVCLHPIDDLTNGCSLFAACTNEKQLPGEINNSFIGATKKHPVLADCISKLNKMRHQYRSYSCFGLAWPRPFPWKSTGASLFSKMLARYRGNDVKILPSESFIPSNTTRKNAIGKTYARHAPWHL